MEAGEKVGGIDGLLEELPLRLGEKEIIRMRYGIGEKEKYTIEEVAHLCGITVRQAEKLCFQATERVCDPRSYRRRLWKIRHMNSLERIIYCNILGVAIHIIHGMVGRSCPRDCIDTLVTVLWDLIPVESQA